MDEKENTAPLSFSHSAELLGLSPSKDERKARSKSIGPGGFEDTTNSYNALQDRTITLLHPNVRGILPDREDAERRAARRKSMANRRVSFAPEATLHIWDVIEHMRDHTTSTEASDRTTRASQPGQHPESPSSQLISEDDRSGLDESGMDSDSETSDDLESGEDDVEDGDDDDDATGTAMSFVTDPDGTQCSNESSTSSSLERNLKLAAEAAGTRGIEYDEFGDMSMEVVGSEVTAAYRPWTEEMPDERRGSATYDQENVNPFQKPEQLVQEDEQGDMSMDVTRAVGGILSNNIAQPASSPFREIPMDFTQAIGSIKPLALPPSSVSRSPQKRSFAEMEGVGDLTASVQISCKKQQVVDTSLPMAKDSQEQDNTDRWTQTMDFTQALGQIHGHSTVSEASFNGDEELSMELTTVIGGIKAQYGAHSPAAGWPDPSSPFRVDVDPTFNKTNDDLLDQQSPEAVQTPTPKAKQVSSGRRSSARLRRTAATDAAHMLDSSPTRRRQSQRQSAASTGLQTPSPAARKTPSPSAAKSRAVIDEGLDGNVTPRTSRRARSASRSPRQTQTFTAAPRHTAVDTPPRPQDLTSAKSTTPTEPVVGQRSMLDNIRSMTTPRKETLKAVTPKKATPSPSRRPRSALRAQQTRASSAQTPKDPARSLFNELSQVTKGSANTHIRLQDFLDTAGIRFMDLTTSKRRLTIATTPSRAKKRDSDLADIEDAPASIALDEAICAAACTEPELELYKHACRELKRYIDEGKDDIKELEAETYRETPTLIQAYMEADSEKRAAVDAQMRDIKANARLRSKEMWYSWRGNLVDELMKALQCIAEGLIEDDETLSHRERVLSTTLTPLLQQKVALQAQAEELSSISNLTKDDDKEQLCEAREELLNIDNVMQQRRLMLEKLQAQLMEQDQLHDELTQAKQECESGIRVIEETRLVAAVPTVEPFAELRDIIENQENSQDWSLRSVEGDTQAVTMTYKSQLELFFHPNAFAAPDETSHPAVNAPIGLSHTMDHNLPTTYRFFLLLLSAYLQTIVQATTNISDVLALVSSTWNCASQIGEIVRLLAIEGVVKATIVNDECLSIESLLLLPLVQTKVSATFNISIDLDTGECNPATEVHVRVVYGQAYNEKNMTESLNKSVDTGLQSWPFAIQKLRTKLVETGPKGTVVQ